jgi:hypothetical protein
MARTQTRAAGTTDENTTPDIENEGVITNGENTTPTEPESGADNSTGGGTDTETPTPGAPDTGGDTTAASEPPDSTGGGTDTETPDADDSTTATFATDGAPALPAPYAGVNIFAYIGPALPNGKVKQNAILQGTFTQVTAYLAEEIEKCPQIAKLIVPVAQLSTASARTKKRGNILNKYYAEAVSALTRRAN